MKRYLVWLTCGWTAWATAAAADLITIGEQGLVVPYPFRGNSGIDAVRCQDLVLSKELYPWDNAPVVYITKWEWFASTTLSPGYFNNFTVKLCQTDRTALTANFEDNYRPFRPGTVYSQPSQYINPNPDDWFGFGVSPFYLFGNYNLLVEVEWSGDTGGYAYTYRSTATARCVFNYNGGTPAVHNYVHYMRITIYFIPGVEPTSLGRVKALYS
jgi:hypothetical protein